MSKSIFILFLFFCSLFSFSQKRSCNTIIKKDCFLNQNNKLENKIIQVDKEQQQIQFVLIYTGNLCDLNTIKATDLLNESMLKKLLANV